MVANDIDDDWASYEVSFRGGTDCMGANTWITSPLQVRGQTALLGITETLLAITDSAQKASGFSHNWVVGNVLRCVCMCSLMVVDVIFKGNPLGLVYLEKDFRSYGFEGYN